MAESFPGATVTASSDDVVAAGLRLLWQLDAFLAEVDANRIDDLTPCVRENLLAALLATSTTIAGVHPRKKGAPAEISEKRKKADGSH